MERSTRASEFWKGVRDEAPILLADLPFGLIYGALALQVHLPAAAAQAMSSVIFAGSAQFIALQLFGAGASALVIVLVVLVVNLRHALYSASVAPYIEHLRPGWKTLLAYLLTDEAYAVVISHFQRDHPPRYRQWYFLGAGLTLWSAWQAATAAGLFIGAQLPQSWPLGFAIPLAFIALVAPVLVDRASLVAAAVAGGLGLATMNFPFKTGLLLAALAGILTGLLLERKQP
jgi:4-azaleucine resistance transporter AzlC